MCISRRPSQTRDCGFTLLELVIGLALAVSLAIAAAPLWHGLETAGTRAADGAVWILQQRVAMGRLERDLRLAGADGCTFPVSGPVLQASEDQVVFLVPSVSRDEPLIVEWEIIGGSLMRRWGVCPPRRLNVFPHSLYLDNKTMLQDIGRASSFTYLVRGTDGGAPVAESDVASIDTVVVHLVNSGSETGGLGSVGSGELTTRARVGR